MEETTHRCLTPGQRAAPDPKVSPLLKWLTQERGLLLKRHTCRPSPQGGDRGSHPGVPWCAPEALRWLLPSPPHPPAAPPRGPSTQRQALFVLSNLTRIFLTTWIFKEVFRNGRKGQRDLPSDETGDGGRTAPQAETSFSQASSSTRRPPRPYVPYRNWEHWM